MEQISEGLVKRGIIGSAAIAATLAYTGKSDEWFRFGGEVSTFLSALTIDETSAWATLADEISRRITMGGGRKVTHRLIDRLLGVGRISDAFDVWDAAKQVVEKRLPRIGPGDDLGTEYDDTSVGPADWISAVIVTRINALFGYEKQIALAAAAVLARYAPRQWASAFRFAICRIWPEFRAHVESQVTTLYESTDMRRRMARVFDAFRLQRKGRWLQRWTPFEEDSEAILHKVAAAISSLPFAPPEFIDEFEDMVGALLLPDTQLSVRSILSRTVRPRSSAPPSSQPRWQIDDVPISGEGDFAGWLLVARRETELITSDKYDAPVQERISSVAGVVFKNQFDGSEDWPFGSGDPRVWHGEANERFSYYGFSGAVAGLSFIRPFGGKRDALLFPNPMIVAHRSLTVAPLTAGLALPDTEGKQAVVCRTWRGPLLGNHPDDLEPILSGSDILMRPDIFDAHPVSTRTTPKLVTTTHRIGQQLTSLASLEELDQFVGV